ncbi:response regulator [Pseudorhodoferax sp.]|uniref:response regulator n=1 Tax=Pseudorhodoferax sp. TaxID=1993553 RepID=UPI0039E2D425
MPAPARLLVVDDHTLFRRGLTALLAAQPALQVVGEAADAGEALRRAAELQPDVILLDHHLPGVSGVDVLQNLRQAAPAARVLMLTVSEDAETLARALRQGAHGYLLKTVDSEMLVAAIERALRGQSTISPEMTDQLVSAFQALRPPAPAVATAAPAPVPADPLAQLSPREREILQEIAAGASNKEIARRLDIAETTVKIHVQHILRKLGLSSRVQAAVLLAGHGR